MYTLHKSNDINDSLNYNDFLGKWRSCKRVEIQSKGSRNGFGFIREPKKVLQDSRESSDDIRQVSIKKSLFLYLM